MLKFQLLYLKRTTCENFLYQTQNPIGLWSNSMNFLKRDGGHLQQIK